MVLGHECVFCWGGPEQRAVHKGCGMERQRRLGRRRDKSRKTANKTASETSPGCSLCLNKGCKTNLKDVCGYKEINKARNAVRHIMNEGCEFPKRQKKQLRFLVLVLSRKDARVDFYSSSLIGTRSFSTTNSAHDNPCRTALWEKKKEKS